MAYRPGALLGTRLTPRHAILGLACIFLLSIYMLVHSNDLTQFDPAGNTDAAESTPESVVTAPNTGQIATAQCTQNIDQLTSSGTTRSGGRWRDRQV
jgi:hypothetical protein